MDEILLNIFINDLENGTDGTISRFTKDIKLGEVANRPSVCVVIQRDLNRMKKWVNRNVIKFNEGKCKVLPLERNNPRQQDSLMCNQLERSLSEKVMVVLTDKSFKSQSHVLVGNASGTLACTEQCCQPIKEVIPPLLRTGKVAPEYCVLAWGPQYET